MIAGLLIGIGGGISAPHIERGDGSRSDRIDGDYYSRFLTLRFCRFGIEFSWWPR